jgi:hypothetical protein
VLSHNEITHDVNIKSLESWSRAVQIKRFGASTRSPVEDQERAGSDAVAFLNAKTRSGGPAEVTAAVDERPEGQRAGCLPARRGCPAAPATEETLSTLRRDVEEIKTLLVDTAKRPSLRGVPETEGDAGHLLRHHGLQRKEKLSGRS